MQYIEIKYTEITILLYYVKLYYIHSTITGTKFIIKLKPRFKPGHQ